MPETGPRNDAEIILAAYADRVSEAFKAFADNISTGQSEASCKERFKRALMWVRRARDVAILAAAEGDLSEPAAAQATAGPAAANPADDLSAEDKAMIEQALSGTTGHMPVAPPPQRYRLR